MSWHLSMSALGLRRWASFRPCSSVYSVLELKPTLPCSLERKGWRVQRKVRLQLSLPSRTLC